MAMKFTVACLVALALLGSLCEAQYRQKPSLHPKQEPSKQLPHVPQQEKKTYEKPLNWEYPKDPMPEPKLDVSFTLKHPVSAATVSVECGEQIAQVRVNKDMFGIGQFINPADLTLGNCNALGLEGQFVIYETELHTCGSSLATTEDFLIYTFTLNYNPQPLGDAPVVRTNQAAVIVECHYPRKHNVSSLPLDPKWIPFSAVKVAEEFLYFSLKLMTDDWINERPSYQYFLGDMIYIEATVMQYFHVPLRVYVDRCIATLSPDMNSNPNYCFIENYGCLVDARITGSASKFMDRTAENKLQFLLEAFRFQGTDSGVIYITCHLKATSTAHPFDNEHRACSYANGWREASGAHAACGTCGDAGGGGKVSPANPGRKYRDVSQAEFVEWEGDVTLGPIPVGEKVIA